MLTHDATLRALETLRLRLLRGLLRLPFNAMARLRGAQAIASLTADIDALDGVPLRLVLPLIAGLGTHVLAVAILWWLVGPALALLSGLGWTLGAALVIWLAARPAAPLARRAEAAMQAMRARIIDLVRSRDTLAAHGRLGAQADSALKAHARFDALRARLDTVERRTGAAVSVLATLMAGGALWLGAAMVQAGQLDAALAALGFFTMLALAETVAPLRRAVADLGRMAVAARRVRRSLDRADAASAGRVALPEYLRVNGIALARPGGAVALVRDLGFELHPRQTLALTGPSGCGKSTVLQALAGLVPLDAGQIMLGDLSLGDWSEDGLRQHITYLPQRSALMAGSVREALQLARPDASDAELWAVLQAVALADTISPNGGLDMVLGPRGAGLSGGESRRLTLARAVLRRPTLLLLDEPTEGLDDATATQVLAGLRRYLPDAMIVLASHHAREAATADRTIMLA